MQFIEAILLISMRFSLLNLVFLTVADKCMVTPAPLPYKSTRRDSDHICKVKVPHWFGPE